MESNERYVMSGDEEGGQIKIRMLALFIYLMSVLVSVTGGFMIGWWAYKYHPDNEELWMVPFGLILFATPILVFFSAFVNYLLNSDDETHHHKDWNASPRVIPVDYDPENDHKSRSA